LPDSVYASWLHSMVSIRNVCAHHERLWNRQLRIQPLSPRKPQNIWLADQSVCNNRIYYVFSIMIYFLNTVNPNHTFRKKLEKLFAKYPNVDRAAMGFPAGWQNEPLWTGA
ncbi:MAG: Abi family protein, partial [Prevotellaceae bacterium]|nr:Abi family protein [Prevotellaceae bacterium]